MRIGILLVAGLLILPATSWAQSEEDAAQRIIDIFKAVQGKDEKPARQPEPATIVSPERAHTLPERQKRLTVIPAGSITAQPIDRSPMLLDRGTIITGPQGGGNPSSGNSFQAPEPPKLKLRLTPKAPAAQGRGYMTYDYPNSVRLTDTQNSVLFSKYNMAGGLRFSAKLEAGKTYLIAIEVAPDNGSGGHLQLYIGGQTSTHQLGSWNDVTVISRVVTPQESGWVSGLLMEGGGQVTDYWEAFAVDLTEMD